MPIKINKAFRMPLYAQEEGMLRHLSSLYDAIRRYSHRDESLSGRTHSLVMM